MASFYENQTETRFSRTFKNSQLLSTVESSIITYTQGPLILISSLKPEINRNNIKKFMTQKITTSLLLTYLLHRAESFLRS